MAVATRTQPRGFAWPRSETIAKVLVFALLAISAYVILLPFFWTLATSFKPETEIVRFPPELLPRSFT